MMPTTANPESDTLYIFISYARPDQPSAEQIADSLAQAGVRYFRDQEHIAGGDNWDMAIEKALQETTHMILLLSKSSMPYREEVHREWFAFNQNRKPILPILLEDCELHSRLTAYNYFDAREGLEPALEKIFKQLDIPVFAPADILSEPDDNVSPTDDADEPPSPPLSTPEDKDGCFLMFKRDDIRFYMEIFGVIVGLATIFGVYIAFMQWQSTRGDSTATPDATEAVISETQAPTEIVLQSSDTPEASSPVPTTAVPIPSATSTESSIDDGEFILLDDNMILIEGGEYPVHDGDSTRTVSLMTYGIDRYEVNRREFRDYLSTGVSLSSEAFNRLESTADNSDLPMSNIGYDEALAYCIWRDKTLPTSAQWEVATAWHPETNTIRDYAWDDDDSYASFANLADDRGQLLSVTSLRSNPLGLHHTIGNVAEWILREDDDYQTRGGHYRSPLADVQLSRDTVTYDSPTPQVLIENMGFRCVQIASAGD